MSNGIDDFYNSTECPTEYIKDISKKMQVPHRISFGDPDVQNIPPAPVDSMHNSEMKVPERLLIAAFNAGHDPGHKKSDFDLADELDLFPLTNGRPSLLPPPSTLVLNEIEYPDVERLIHETEEEQQQSSLISETKKDDHIQTPKSIPSTHQENNSAYQSDMEIRTDRRLRVLEKRVLLLEHEQVRRKQIDQLGLIALGIFLMVRLLRAVF